MIEVEFNDSDVMEALAKLSRSLTNLSPLWTTMGDSLIASTERRFDHTEGPDGSKWVPRSATTLERYKKKGTSFGPILHLTRELRDNFNYHYDANSMTLGSNVLHAAVMQFGAEKQSLGPRSPWGNIPARPFIGISVSDREDIFKIINEWLIDAVSN